MKYTLFGFCSLLVASLLSCTNPEEKQSDSTTETGDPQDSGETSAYGSCSLELVAASSATFSASTIGATKVVIRLAFLHEEHGEQMEEHPLQQGEEGVSSISWFMELESVETPEDEILGQSTLWSASVFDPTDTVFVALNENDELCDCWDIKDEYGAIDCTTYGVE